MGVLLFSSISMAGCRKKEQKSTEIKIGVCVYDQYDTYLDQLIQCFDKCTTDGVNVEYVYASQSQITQNEQVEKLITKGVDVLCVNLVDRTAPNTIIDLAKKNDVPIIFFNRELVEEDITQWPKLYYVGADAFESGRLQGELAANMLRRESVNADKNGDGRIQYVVLEGEAGHQDAIVRTEYSVNTLIEQGVDVDKVGYAIANWNRAQAQTKMAQLIERTENGIELVLANNDDMALGAVDAYNSAKISADERPLIFGIDGTDVGLEAVVNKTIMGTIYNDKEGQAKAMYDLAIALAKGESVSSLNLEDGRYIRLPYAKVDAANVLQYIHK
ncbi:MAG: galactose ABC transporter substrate-binding protein [Butyrivibrio sp.]|nr:galactose ABC transporter substrate-binding protein [Butyrivibrio sp.]